MVSPWFFTFLFDFTCRFFIWKQSDWIICRDSSGMTSMPFQTLGETCLSGPFFGGTRSSCPTHDIGSSIPLLRA